MLNQEQRDRFRLALSALNNYSVRNVADLDIDDVAEDAQVVETAETIEDFLSSRGRRLDRKGRAPYPPFEHHETLCGAVYKWDDVQARPGARRGTLYVMDFGAARAAFFDGEA